MMDQQRRRVADHAFLRKTVPGPRATIKAAGRVILAAGLGTLLWAGSCGQRELSGTVSAGFISPDIRSSQYFDSSDTAPETTQSYQVKGWRAEKVAMQILVQAKDSLTDLRVQAGDLVPVTAEGNSKIEANAVTAGFVRFVVANDIGKSGSGCGIDTATQHLSRIMADGIQYSDRTGVAALGNQPIWVSVAIPADAAPGDYKGQLELNFTTLSGDQGTKRLDYQLTVQHRTLPAPGDWQFHLDLWQYPESVARWYDLSPWSEEHFEKMRPYMQRLADVGQKVITTSIINDPWNGQTYDPYSSMIKWTKNKDGSWQYDYRVFDQWVSFMMELGIDKQINCYSMVPWHNTYLYFDAATGTEQKLVAEPGSPAYNQFWKTMLEDFARHLKQKGWFDKTCIAMDERPLKDMQKVIDLVKGLEHPFKLSLAGGYHRELDSSIYDYCITTRERFDEDVLQRRLAAGQPTTYYTCCTEDLPNTFTFSPPAEAAFIPLLSMSRNLTGYLRWAYNAWPADPHHDSRFGTWSSGDTYFVYPGPGSSIRFEQLTRGIQDYEKIRILKEELAAAGDRQGLEKLKDALNNIEVDNLRKQGAAPLVQQVETVINEL